MSKKIINQEKTYGEWLEFVRGRGYNLKFVPKKYKTYELCNLALKSRGCSIKYVPKHLMELYPDLLKTAVDEDGSALHFIPYKYRTEELCKLAVEDDGDAIFDVPMRFRTRELCLLAIDDMCDNPFECFPKELINDESFLKEMIDIDWSMMKYVPEKYYNTELLKYIVSMHKKAIKYIKNKYITEDLVLLALNKCNYNDMFFEIPKRFKNEEFFKKLIIHYDNFLKVDSSNINTRELWIKIIDNFPALIKYIPEEYKCYELYKYFIKSAKLKNSLKYVPKEFRTKEIYELGFNLKLNTIRNIPEEFITKEMIDITLENKPNYIKYIPEKYMTKENAYKVLQKDTYLYKNIDEEILKELSDVFEIIKTSHRDVHVIKLENGEYRFSVGCQINITKDEFINRIHHDGDCVYVEDGLKRYPHRQEYLNILERY